MSEIKTNSRRSFLKFSALAGVAGISGAFGDDGRTRD